MYHSQICPADRALPLPVAATLDADEREQTRGVAYTESRGEGGGNSLACVGHWKRRDGASLGWGPGQARTNQTRPGDGPVKQAIHPSAAGRQQLQAARRCEYATQIGVNRLAYYACHRSD